LAAKYKGKDELRQTQSLLYLGELNTCWDLTRRLNVADATYLDDKVVNFVKKHILKDTIAEAIDMVKKGNYVGLSGVLLKGGASLDETDIDADGLMTWEDVERLMAEEPPVYVLDQILALGEVSMIHAGPMVGKSALLASLIAAVCCGKPWL